MVPSRVDPECEPRVVFGGYPYFDLDTEAVDLCGRCVVVSVVVTGGVADSGS